MLGIGPLELLIVLGILLVIFGARRLPQIGRDLGSGMREFKDSVTGKSRDEDKQPELSAGPAAPLPGEEREVAGAGREKDPSGRSA